MMARGGGLITGLIMGIVALVITVMVGYVIISNVSTVESDLATAGHSQVVINETGYINDSIPYRLATTNATGWTTPVIIGLYNATTSGTIPLANVTVNASGHIHNTTILTFNVAQISYTYKYKGTTDTVSAMRGNFTEGVDEVSDKIPTILLIAAVVLILGVLVFLWAQYKRMNVGGAGEL